MTDDSFDLKEWERRAALRAFAKNQRETRRRSLDAIIAAAIELAGEGDDFTVKQVADRAGVAVDTLYRHFGSKDELILATLEELTAAGWLRAAATGIEAPLERLRYLVTASLVMPWTNEERQVIAFAARETQRLLPSHPKQAERVLSPIRNLIIEAIVDAQAAGALASDDPALDAELILQLRVALTNVIAAGGFEWPPQQIADRAWQLWLKALDADRQYPRPSPNEQNRDLRNDGIDPAR